MTDTTCLLPEDLYYWPEKHVWARPEGKDEVVVGMTDVAQSLAGKIIVVNLRSMGKILARGKSAGTLESGKWVGSIPTPVAGEVVAVNEAVTRSPVTINSDPYGEGWLIRVKPSDWEADATELLHGAEGVQAYRERLAAEGITCKKV